MLRWRRGQARVRGWWRVTWPLRTLLAVVLVGWWATRATMGPRPFPDYTAQQHVWAFLAVHAAAVAVLGTLLFITARRFFRQPAEPGVLRPYRRRFRRRLVYLGCLAGSMHQMEIWRLDYRYWIDYVMKEPSALVVVKRSPPFPLEGAIATALLAGYALLLTLLWFRARTPGLDVVPQPVATSPTASDPAAELDALFTRPSPTASRRSVDVPRDPATGRVRRMFDLS